MAKLIDYLRDHSDVLKALFFGFLVFSLIFDFFAVRHEPHFFGDKIIGFWSIFGILACLGTIVVCKGLCHNLLAKDEDYYDQ